MHYEQVPGAYRKRVKQEAKKGFSYDVSGMRGKGTISGFRKGGV